MRRGSDGFPARTDTQRSPNTGLRSSEVSAVHSFEAKKYITATASAMTIASRISSYASGLTDLERLTVRIAEKFSAKFLLLSRVVDRRRRSETSTRDKQRVPPSRRE